MANKANTVDATSTANTATTAITANISNTATTVHTVKKMQPIYRILKDQIGLPYESLNCFFVIFTKPGCSMNAFVINYFVQSVILCENIFTTPSLQNRKS